MVNWNKTSLVWGLPAVEQEGFARQAVHSTLRLFMDRGAVVTSDSAAVPDSMFCGESAQIRDAIVAAGYAQARGTGWTLTLEGANEMMGSKALSSPQPFFRIRDCIALEDMTEYELIKTLQDRGWSWCLWVPPSKRRKRDPPLPIGYRRHDPLVYYTTAKVQCGYLIALAKSEDLFERNVTSVVLHAEKDKYYQKLLAGEDTMQHEALQLDIEEYKECPPPAPKKLRAITAGGEAVLDGGVDDGDDTHCDGGIDGGNRDDGRESEGGSEADSLGAALEDLIEEYRGVPPPVYEEDAAVDDAPWSIARCTRWGIANG